MLRINKALRAFVFGAVASAGSLFATTMPAFAAGLYLPIGPQQNVSVSDVTSNGWSTCYSATYGTPLGVTADSAVSGCSGDLLMLAARRTGSSVFSVLAAASRGDVLNQTTGNNTTNSNGSEWYYRPYWSWGFAPGGGTIALGSADVTGFGSNDRISWHLLDNVGGWRAGDVSWLNGSSDWEKVILTANSSPTAIPTPALLPGLIGMGVAALRKKGKKEELVEQEA